MLLVLSLVCWGFSTWLLVDYFALTGTYFTLFPAFSATAAALVGLIIAKMDHSTKKGKKRRLPMTMLFLNTLVCIVATVLWMLRLLGRIA